MWNPLLFLEVVDNAHYVEELLGVRGRMRPIEPQQLRFMGKTPWNFSMGWSSCPPCYGDISTPRGVEACVPM